MGVHSRGADAAIGPRDRFVQVADERRVWIGMRVDDERASCPLQRALNGGGQRGMMRSIPAVEIPRTPLVAHVSTNARTVVPVRVEHAESNTRHRFRRVILESLHIDGEPACRRRDELSVGPIACEQPVGEVIRRRGNVQGELVAVDDVIRERFRRNHGARVRDVDDHRRHGKVQMMHALAPRCGKLKSLWRRLRAGPPSVHRRTYPPLTSSQWKRTNDTASSRDRK